MTEYFIEHELIDYVTGTATRSSNRMGGVALILNLDQEHAAHCELTFFYQHREPAVYTVVVPQSRQALVWFGDQRFGLVPPGIDFSQRFGLRLRSDRPVIVQSTQGDSKIDDPVTNSMVTQMFCQGPLTANHKEWYYIDSILITGVDNPLEEREWLSVLNPGANDAAILLTFIPGGTLKFPEGVLEMEDLDEQPVLYRFTAERQRLSCTDLANIPGIVPNHHYAVRLSSSEPVTFMGIRRIFRRGHYDYSTSVAFLDAIPVGNG
jgi:hypothetical protein